MFRVVLVASWALVSLASDQILGSFRPLGTASFAGKEEYDDDDITEFNAAPLHMLGRPAFALGSPIIKALNSNFTFGNDAVVKGCGKTAGGYSTGCRGREIRRAPPSNVNIPFVFPPPAKLPLPSCFYNPSGYVCCNRDLYNLIEEKMRELNDNPRHNPCNIQGAVNNIHTAASNKFNISMEAMMGLDDFAQKVRFRGNFACKLEFAGKYIMVYATPSSTGAGRKKRETPQLPETAAVF